MKARKHKRITAVLLTLALVLLMSVPTVVFAAEPTVNLGTTSTFAVLAGSAITNTGPTGISGDAGGDIGLHPGLATAYTGSASVTTTGTAYLADAVALLAKTDLVTAYDDAAGRTTAVTIPSELGGRTLTPGVYDSADGTFHITGTLTLDAQGDPDAVFIFQMASTLTTANNSAVVLANGARYCRTFWQVGSSATLGTNSNFVGHIFAMTSITATTGARIQGQLLARNGAVTLDTNTITNGVCAVAPPPSSGGDSSPVGHPPLINITKVPSPLALTSGSGMVTYTYQVTNLGDVPMRDISVTDDQIDLVSYVSGDVNSDDILQVSESWIYTSQAMLDETTMNTATARGSWGGMDAMDIAYATVSVSDIIPPLINVTKTPSPLALDTGRGPVTYTYRITNPGTEPLSNVSLIDNKISQLNYVSGDVNSDNLLQHGETWTYTAQTTLYQTTTNLATATGDANGMTATDIAFATVVVTPVTITGGELPSTSVPGYNVFFIGLAFILAGGLFWSIKKHYE